MHAAKFALINIAAVALVVLAAAQGWIRMVIEADNSGIVFVITALTLATLVLIGYRGITAKRPIGELLASTEKRFDELLETPRRAINACPILGLFGTVVGFIMTLAEVNLAAGETSQMLQGIGVALVTTLVGLIAALWLDAALRPLEGLYTELLIRDS